MTESPQLLSLPRERRRHVRSASVGRRVTPRRESSDVPNFLFQQPAYDADVYEQRPHSNSSYKRGWNTSMAVYVKRMGQRAGGYKWMHSQASDWFNKRYQWIGITSIIINGVATAGNIPYVAACQNELDWIKITSIVLGLFVTLVLAFQQFKDYGARSSQHRASEANYAALYDHIKQQLHKNSRDRQDANDYVEWISKELNDLKASSPALPPLLLTRYRAMIAGQNVADPEGIDEIVIKRDSPDRVDDRSAAAPAPPGDLVEVVVEPHPQPVVPRAGRLIVTYNDDEDVSIEQESAAHRIALERWNDSN